MTCLHCSMNDGAVRGYAVAIDGVDQTAWLHPDCRAAWLAAQLAPPDPDSAARFTTTAVAQTVVFKRGSPRNPPINNQRFGKLTVLWDTYRAAGVRCDCGAEFTAVRSQLTSGMVDRCSRCNQARASL
jgi:hypothetical protein